MVRYTYFRQAMRSQDTLNIDLRALDEGQTRLEAVLGDDFFEAVGGSEVSRGCVQAEVEIARHADLFDIRLSISGTVLVPCDLCLDDMEQPVEGTLRLAAQLGVPATEAGADDNETISVDEADGTLDLSWHAYETIALAIPSRHVHADGQCNPQMAAALAAHTPGQSSTEGSVDPRWSALEKLRKQ